MNFCPGVQPASALMWGNSLSDAKIRKISRIRGQALVTDTNGTHNRAWGNSIRPLGFVSSEWFERKERIFRVLGYFYKCRTLAIIADLDERKEGSLIRSFFERKSNHRIWEVRGWQMAAERNILGGGSGETGQRHLFLQNLPDFRIYGYRVSLAYVRWLWTGS